jgi:hypothetical protein
MTNKPKISPLSGKTLLSTFETGEAVRSNIKNMAMTSLFDCEDIVHQEFILSGHTVNQHYYGEVLQRMKQQVRRKLPKRWWKQNRLIHYDNMPGHTALSVQQFVAAITRFRRLATTYHKHLIKHSNDSISG